MSLLIVCNLITGHFDCEKFKKVNIEQFRTMEENTKSVLCILVGFYVSIQIGRWWSQTSRMPKLNKLAIELNAIMQIGKLVKSKVETIWFPSGIPAHCRTRAQRKFCPFTYQGA